jgi:hypothetical protein
MYETGCALCPKGRQPTSIAWFALAWCCGAHQCAVSEVVVVVSHAISAHTRPLLPPAPPKRSPKPSPRQSYKQSPKPPPKRSPQPHTT